MKRLALVALIATAAVAVHAETYVDYARVRSAEPQYESVSVPRNECTSQVVNEVQPVGGQRQYGGALIGGVAGALLGNQVGHGHGKEAATAVGAVVGAFTGDQLANANTPVRVPAGSARSDELPHRERAADAHLRLSRRLRVSRPVLHHDAA